MSLKFITMPDGSRYRWKEILRLRREQEKAARQPSQEPLFPLHDDSRPVSQRTTAGRYQEPTMFKVD